MDDLPAIGDTFTAAQLSPCVGGLLRTWTDTDEGRLWSVDDADWLRSMQGTGTISRTLRHATNFREVGSLSETSGTLMLHGRYPVKSADDSLLLETNTIRLRPAEEPTESVYDDMVSLLKQAVWHALRNNEFLVVEPGGWDAPAEPFCLQVVVGDGDEFISLVQTSPPPHNSDIWAPHIVADQQLATLTAPANEHTIGVAPLVIMEAISLWGLGPWDLALTFGKRWHVVEIIAANAGPPQTVRGVALVHRLGSLSK